ncbi:MAG: 1-deoxy-D-xylulose-5-phosphate synthase, partial [Deltaproteobacteria bacterium]|nr:1-deoxy-D-xylulose-5-phosphate synthase [Deltaproteobacteria bacterium]
SYAHKQAALFSVEENVLQGGFGSAILELLQQHGCTAALTTLGIPDTFVEHGPQDRLRAHYGIDADGIYEAVKQNLQTRLARREET